jgi:predicted aconitase
MVLKLSEKDRGMLEGSYGQATQLAMSVIIRMAELSQAENLMDITCAHIDSSIYTGEASLEFAERLADLGAKVAVPSTLNTSSLDENGWGDWAVPEEWAEKAQRQMKAYLKMGCIPIWTCAPYETEFRPQFGQQIAWGESNAIVFANSVIGARTERYPNLLDICIAITGRAPAVGLHRAENRAGQILLRLVDVPKEMQAEDSFYPVLGHIMGKVSEDHIPVVENLSYRPSEDQLKALGAASASSGGVPLFHIVGVTPEAPTLEDAFQGSIPQKVYEVTKEILLDTYKELTTSSNGKADLVILGCPHFSLKDFKKLAPLLKGKVLHPDVSFLITTSRGVMEGAKKAGYMSAIHQFGGKVAVDTCILISPMLPSEIKSIMTNSGKCAYYTPGKLERQVHFGGLEDCVNAAVNGYVMKENSIWKE